MNDFKRGQSTKKALEIGNITVYKEKWDKEMTGELFGASTDWADELAIEYTYARMDFQTGYYNFYSVNMAQEKERVFTISFEEFIKELNEFVLARSLENIF